MTQFEIREPDDTENWTTNSKSGSLDYSNSTCQLITLRQSK